MKLIKRVAPRTFLAINGKNTVHLQFAPFIEHYNLKGNFILLHWNRIFKQYGFYDGFDDSYITHPAKHTLVNVFGELGEIFPDVPLLPTACLIYRDSEVTFNNKTLHIVGSPNG